MSTTQKHYRIHRDGQPDIYQRRHDSLDDAKASLLAMLNPEQLEIREYNVHGKSTFVYYRPGPELLAA